jgi:hypothetical protein
MIYFFNLHQKYDDELISNSKEENTGLLGEGKTIKEDGEIIYSPSDELIKNILNFSKSYKTAETKSSGYVEMNLN